MGRVLVKSSLPSKVFVKFDDDYEYAYDANNNIVLVQSPKSRGRPTTRGERVASVVGNVAGVGRSLLQPANTFSQFLSNLRTGAQLGGQDLRSLYRNFLETRGARRRAANRQAVADRNERQDELFRQAVRSGQIQIEGPRFGGTSRQQRQNALGDLSAVQDVAGERRRNMQALGAEIAEMVARQQNVRPEDLSLPEMQGGLQNLRNLAAVGARGGNYVPVVVPPAPNLPVIQPPPISNVPRPSPFALQNQQLITDIEGLADFKPMSGTRSKPSQQSIVNAAGETIGEVGSGPSISAMNAIPSPEQGVLSANKEEAAGTPAPNAMVPTTAKEPTEQQQEEDEEETDIEDAIKRVIGQRFGSGAEA